MIVTTISRLLSLCYKGFIVVTKLVIVFVVDVVIHY